MPGAAAATTSSKKAHTAQTTTCTTKKLHRRGQLLRVRRCVTVVKQAKPKIPLPVTSTPTVVPLPSAATAAKIDPQWTATAAEATLNQQIIDCTNAARAQHGLPALAADAALGRAAQGHATDMSTQNYFAHDSLDGRSPWDRIDAAMLGETPFQAMAENIAMGFTDAQSTCDAWMNSPGHRENILNPTYKYIGAGWSDGYSVEDFGAH